MRSTRNNPGMPDNNGPIVITFYSHKGGVGKTTSVHNVAHLLSKKLNYRVLLVDGDPQCSLSSLVLRKSIMENSKSAAKGKDKGKGKAKSDEVENNDDITTDLKNWDDRVHQYIDTNYSNHNVYKMFDVLCEQKFAGNVEEHLKNSMNNILLLTPDSENPDLLFLVGNKNFYKLEGPLTTALTSASTYTLYHGLSASLSFYLRELGKKNKVDFVLIDLNPGSTILNASLLLGSDYFTVPIMPDHFSRQAIWSLSNIIPDWEEKFKDMRVTQGSPLTSRKLPTNPPIFLGIIPQRVKVFNKKPAKAYAQWLTNIYTELTQSFCKKLANYKMIKEDFKKFPNNFIPRIDATIIKAQRQGMPVVAMKKNTYIDSLEENYMNIIFSLFFNLRDIHKMHLDVQDRFDAAGMKVTFSVKSGKRLESDSDIANAEVFPYPIPLTKQHLSAFLSDKKNMDIFRNAVAKECLNIDNNTLNSNSLKENAVVAEFINFSEIIYSDIFELSTKIRDDLYAPQFLKLKKDANDLSQSIFENSISTNIDQINAFLALSKKLTRAIQEQKGLDDSLESQQERLGACLTQLTERVSELGALKQEFSNRFAQISFYEFFTLKWLLGKDSFLTYYDPDQRPLIEQILIELGISLIITDFEQDNDDLIDDLHINCGENSNKTNECFMKKNQEGNFIIDSKRSKYTINHSFSNVSAYQYDIVENYRNRWKKKAAIASSQNETSPVIISFFNHKGGVAKTTSCQNIAFMLGKAGYRVLLVDTDTQCNLSSVMMGSDYHHFYDEQRAYYNNENSTKDRPNARSLRQTYAVLNEIIKDNDINLDNVELYETRFERVYIMPSSTMHFVEVEFALSDILQSRKPRDWKCYENASKLFEKLGKHFKFDVVIVDMCPSISSTNEMILMQSNYFVVPLLADYLSSQGIKSLPAIIKEWAMKHYAFCLNKGIDISTVSIPQLLQVIPQKYSFTKDFKPSQIHQHYLNEIFSYATTFFLKDFKATQVNLTGATFSENQLAIISTQLKSIIPDKALTRLQGIPDYNTFGLRAQESNDPICYTPYKNFKGDRTSKKAYQDKIDLYSSRYNEIVNDIIARVGLRTIHHNQNSEASIPSERANLSLLSADQPLIRYSATTPASGKTKANDAPPTDSSKRQRTGSLCLTMDLSDFDDDEPDLQQPGVSTNSHSSRAK